jgi:lipopolysaccharide/colanic/teichoic acid biosynthesis glycosyltransferase
MDNRKDAYGNLLPDEIRLNKYGRFLRRTSLDELPELFNILIGDMAIIGPRPLLVKYLPRYNEEQRHRHDVRPGLTGYAQAHGRNSVSWEDKFAMDVWYARNISFALDCQIIVDTVKAVVKRDGISSETSATMEEFLGTPEGVESEWKGPER